MKSRVLFLCTGNSCRSQMAEGLLRHLADGRFDVASAGTHPVGLNPRAVAIMREIGIDISQQRSKPVDEILSRDFDYVVTVCDHAKESCPALPTTSKVLHWSFDDPAAARGTDDDQRATFRRVRDEIRTAVERFIKIERPGG
ncbi:MAG: arsenate reductase ArsC [Nitrospiraceae bacterium]